MKNCNAEIGDSIFFACGKEKEIVKILSMARNKIAQDLNIIDKNKFAFCWIVDYPMYEFDEIGKKIIFSHNPFSMPQGKIEELNFDKPLMLIFSTPKQFNWWRLLELSMEGTETCQVLNIGIIRLCNTVIREEATKICNKHNN